MADLLDQQRHIRLVDCGVGTADRAQISRIANEDGGGVGAVFLLDKAQTDKRARDAGNLLDRLNGPPRRPAYMRAGRSRP